MKVKRNRFEVAQERVDIRSFLLEELVPSEGRKLPMQDLFDSYQKYRDRNGFSQTLLIVDGFGKMFPSHFERHVLSIDGVLYKGLIGYSLRKPA